ALQERNFAFFFAPKYHPAFKHIAAARKLCSERGQRTIFNFLGPLLNPARPTVQLVGVPRPDLCSPLARVLQMLGVHHGMVVSGEVRRDSQATAYLDELSTLGKNHVEEFHDQGVASAPIIDGANLSLEPATLDDLAGGDREANAQIVRRLVGGQER